MTPPPSKEALELAVEALLHRARKSEEYVDDVRFSHMRKLIADAAAADRAAAKEIQDYLDAKEGLQ